jgi:hypothetical protein
LEPPAGVLAELKKIHPLLGLRYLPFQRDWAIVWFWDENDPRRRRVQRQSVTPKDAHTIVCILPPDCPPEQAAGYAMRNLVINPPAAMWEAARTRVNDHNEKVEQAVMDVALADVQNRIEVSAKSLKAHFVEKAEDTDIRCHSVVDTVSPEELREIARVQEQEGGA